MACDLRFAGESSLFAVTSAQIGSVAGMGGTQRLPRLVGVSRAKDIILSARRFEVQEAFAMGLVDRVHPDEEVMARASEWITMCAERAPIAVWLGKIALNVGSEIDLDNALVLESLLTTLCATTEDRQEGMRAILEKRAPIFKGR
jgi:enoyl-CoA hydratase/carnithine racemase